jgi:prolipoprotein diacylglyceryltransferase
MPFVIDIDPVLIQLGPAAIRWYSLALIAAVAVAYLIARRGTRRAGIPDAILADGAIWVGLAALVGGRVLFEIQNDLPMLAVDPFHAVMVWDGGLSFQIRETGGQFRRALLATVNVVMPRLVSEANLHPHRSPPRFRGLDVRHPSSSRAGQTS